ncbi:hypothetical protein ACGFRB_13620 [Streptomyces sp. NPDC048718]|uniref:hypothetical protein n=1 Tax=Streptomyces sp. NPDC048718 TaxID=3365587 RepID=UPI003723C5B4
MTVPQGLDPQLLALGQSDDWEARGGQAGDYHFRGEVWNPKKVSETAGVGGHDLSGNLAGPRPGHPAGYRPVKRYQPGRPSWPKGGSATVGLTDGPRTAGHRPVKAGTLPVWVAPAEPAAEPAAGTKAPHAVPDDGQHDHHDRHDDHHDLFGWRWRR